MKSIILTVTNDLNYDQRMHHICSSLADTGYTVLLVGREKKNSLQLTKQLFNQKRLTCFFNKGKLFYVEYNIRLFLFLLFKKCDCICAVDLDTILPCLVVSRLKNIFCVYDAHEYFPEVPEVITRKFTQYVWKLVERITVPRVDLRYTVSQGLKEIFEAKYNVPFYVIRNLPVLEDLQPVEKKEKIILYQGALNMGRGIEQTIEAMLNVDAELWLVGDGDITDKLKNMVSALHLGSKVRFMGYVLPANLKKITTQATIGMNVSENIGESYFYALNNKIFDYIHAGLPAVNTNFPEIKKINDDYYTGVIINDCKPVDIANAINKLLNDNKLYTELKENCMKARLVFNWQNEEKKLLALYMVLNNKEK